MSNQSPQKPTIEHLGDQILSDLKASLKDGWEKLPAQYQAELTMASIRLGKLMIVKATGKDVSEDIADVDAQLANWTFTGAAAVRSTFWSVVGKIADRAGQYLVTFSATFAAGLVQGMAQG